MLKDNNLLFKQITEKIAEVDFSGYTIQYPPLFIWEDTISDKEILGAWIKIIKTKPKYLGLYIHIPFCKQRCSYCRYFSLELQKESDLENYLLMLKKEIKIYQRILSKNPIRSVYIGGGSPSLLSIKQLDKLFSCLSKNFNLFQCQQIAFEANPDFLSQGKLRLLKQWGVNRLTIGVQSLDTKVIKAVNRYQSPDYFLKCYKMARKAKIENINVDIMVGLPSQTIDSAVKTLKTIIRLQPDMIHVHPFYPTSLSIFIKNDKRLSKADMRGRGRMALISQNLIQNSGYKPIKFDADGKSEAARNIQLSDAIEYNAPFLGLGAGAVSHATNYFRYVNVNDINKNRLPILSAYPLTEKDEMIYFVTACLRYGKVDKFQFEKIFGQGLLKIFQKQIEYLENRRKIKDNPHALISLMKNIGEYLVFSKYFYSQEIIDKCKKCLSWREGSIRKIKKEEFRYMCL